MKKILVGMFSVMLVLAACGGGDDGGNNGDTGDTGDTGEEQSGEESGQESGGEQTAQAGEEVYKTNCASCHGGDLSGGMGPSLKNVGDNYSADDIVGIIKNGKGQMPAQDQVSEEDAQKLPIG
ncbi:c-type cytochrome [Piscibacillus salipiscarius]|uniref:c-type cytochrome n=1 Tax=Piscibacillus salipiscarius TaxID=299480 RepID=UPI0006D13C4A|nr:cytochrome c [Piscibacillus salipiscarius]